MAIIELSSTQYIADTQAEVTKPVVAALSYGATIFCIDTKKTLTKNGDGDLDSSVSPDGQTFTGAVKSSSPSAGIGYASGAGGAVTQSTSKSTGVTINAICGTITMNGAALAGTTSVSFTVTNSSVVSTDNVIVSIASGATNNTYLLQVDDIANGSFRIHLRNISGTSRSQALVLNFSIIKGVSS